MVPLHALCFPVFFPTCAANILATTACCELISTYHLALQAPPQLPSHPPGPHPFPCYDKSISDCSVCILRHLEPSNKVWPSTAHLPTSALALSTWLTLWPP